MRTLLQLLGLTCRHPYLSRPMGDHRSCSACGKQFPHSYVIAPEEMHTIEHYTVKDKSIRRVSTRLLRFKRKGQSR